MHYKRKQKTLPQKQKSNKNLLKYKIRKLLRSLNKIENKQIIILFSYLAY